MSREELKYSGGRHSNQLCGLHYRAFVTMSESSIVPILWSPSDTMNCDPRLALVRSRSTAGSITNTDQIGY